MIELDWCFIPKISLIIFKWRKTKFDRLMTLLVNTRWAKYQILEIISTINFMAACFPNQRNILEHMDCYYLEWSSIILVQLGTITGSPYCLQLSSICSSSAYSSRWLSRIQELFLKYYLSSKTLNTLISH